MFCLGIGLVPARTERVYNIYYYTRAVEQDPSNINIMSSAVLALFLVIRSGIKSMPRPPFLLRFDVSLVCVFESGCKQSMMNNSTVKNVWDTCLHQLVVKRIEYS